MGEVVFGEGLDGDEADAGVVALRGEDLLGGEDIETGHEAVEEGGFAAADGDFDLLLQGCDEGL